MGKDTETVVTVVSQDLREHQPAAATTPCLVVMYGKNLGKRHFLDKAEQILGRSDSVSIQIDQDSVSRQHAKISPEPGGHVVYDLNSANGTFVNDVQVKRQKLSPSDIVRSMLVSTPCGHRIETLMPSALCEIARFSANPTAACLVVE